jgi:hypothetical protein
MRNHALSDNRCPHCDTKLDAATFIGREPIQPAANDVAICIKCGKWMRYGPDLKAKAISREMAFHGLSLEAVMQAMLAEKFIAEKKARRN